LRAHFCTLVLCVFQVIVLASGQQVALKPDNFRAVAPSSKNAGATVASTAQSTPAAAAPPPTQGATAAKPNSLPHGAGTNPESAAKTQQQPEKATAASRPLPPKLSSGSDSDASNSNVRVASTKASSSSSGFNTVKGETTNPTVVRTASSAPTTTTSSSAAAAAAVPGELGVRATVSEVLEALRGATDPKSVLARFTKAELVEVILEQQRTTAEINGYMTALVEKVMARCPEALGT
jgi:hypothetical protein